MSSVDCEGDRRAPTSGSANGAPAMLWPLTKTDQMAAVTARRGAVTEYSRSVSDVDSL